MTRTPLTPSLNSYSDAARGPSIWMTGLAVLVLLVGSCYAVLRFLSYDFNQALEGYCLYGALEVSEGKALYPQDNASPYYVYMLSPLHGWIAGHWVRLLGAVSLYSKVLGIRSISIMSFIGILMLLFRPLRIPAVSYRILLISLALASPRFIDYLSTGRNDVASVVCELLVAWVFSVWIQRRDRLSYSAFFLMAIVSVYLRQTGVVAATASVIWLMREKQFVRAILTGLCWVVACFVLFVLAQHLTAGAFYEHVISANIRSYATSWRENLFARSTFVFFALHAPFFYYSLRGSRLVRSSSHLGYLAVCFWAACAVGSALLFRPGGDTNYYLPALAFGIPFAALGLERTKGRLGLLLCEIVLVVSVFLAVQRIRHHEVPRYLAVLDQIKELKQPHFLVTGSEGDSLIVHLRPRAIHGPSLTNHPAPVAEVAGTRFLFVYWELYHRIQKGELTQAVLAEAGCEHKELLADAIWPERLHRVVSDFRLTRAFAPGVCLYTYAPTAP